MENEIEDLKYTGKEDMFELLQKQAKASHLGGRMSRDEEVAALNQTIITLKSELDWKTSTHDAFVASHHQTVQHIADQRDKLMEELQELALSNSSLVKQFNQQTETNQELRVYLAKAREDADTEALVLEGYRMQFSEYKTKLTEQSRALAAGDEIYEMMIHGIKYFHESSLLYKELSAGLEAYRALRPEAKGAVSGMCCPKHLAVALEQPAPETCKVFAEGDYPCDNPLPCSIHKGEK